MNWRNIAGIAIASIGKRHDKPSTIMNVPDRNQVSGRRIRRILRTAWTEPVVILEGLGGARHCDIVLELDDQKRYSLFYSDLTASEHPLDSLCDLERELRPDWSFGMIRELVTDPWDCLHVILENGHHLWMDPGAANGLACKIDGGGIGELSELDGVKIDLRDYWNGEIVNILDPQE